MPRYFTVEEATSLLPRLTEILLDMQARKRELLAEDAASVRQTLEAIQVLQRRKG